MPFWRGRPPSQPANRSGSHQRQGRTLASLTTIIWVDPATYLPVRLTSQWTRPTVSVPATFDFEWLPPTSANLALLKVRIPPGYTQVHIHCIKTGCTGS